MRKWLLIFCIAQGVYLFSPSLDSLYAQTNVSGPITQNTTWDLAGSPYIVTGDVTVNAGVTLTIDAGVEVKFNGNYSLTVNGTLNSLGTAAQRVKFTSNQAAPARGDWDKIWFLNTVGTHTLNYLEVEYANRGIRAGNRQSGVYVQISIQDSVFANNNVGVYVEGLSTATIQNSSFQNNGTGISNDWSIGDGNITVTNSTITNNTDGVSVLCNNCVARINNNSIYGNNGYNVYASGWSSQAIIDAQHNWWGTVDPSVIMAGIYDY